MEILHKYGYSGQYYHDSGIVFNEHPYIVSIMTAESSRMNVVTEISKLIYEYHKNK